MIKTAYIFPGQGSQTVGMGLDLYESYASARAVFDEADRVLGFSISRLCFEGPEEELNLTINAQPALLTMEIASLNAVREEVADTLPPASYVAGHSLGEYTALTVAGVFDFATAVKLARERGQLMHEAGQTMQGSMAAVIGLEKSILEEVCHETGVWIANFNCPGQIVISGVADKIIIASKLAKERGAKMTIPLQVSGAFHSPLMKQAAYGLSNALSQVFMCKSKIPVISNTNAQEIINSDEAVRQELLNQLSSSVQWERSIGFLLEQKVGAFIEFGPGNALTGMIGRITSNANLLNVGNVNEVRNFSEKLGKWL